MIDVRPRRSALYLPGTNERALEKAKTLPADVVIIDLEDAVAPELKEEARSRVCEAVREGGFGEREVVIRVNALGTPWGRDDLEAAVAAGPSAVLVTKVGRPEDVDEARDLAERGGAGETVELWAMIETPHAMLNLREIAAKAEESGPRFGAFVLGTNDLAKETGARQVPGRAPMLPWISAAVIAARAYGLAVLDGVCNDFRNGEALVAECRQARDMGLDGKTLIHPSQIGPANEIFAPGEEDLAEARAIIEAFDRPENKGKGAINLGGRMVEILHADIARRTLALHEVIGRKAR
ncbi:HpcH/HpaI aldolase/citrate lyase family protein [Lutibaculum baratangense]|uniref:Citryl-CoA lyase n=1 Tax=Lutibaculum baratangense AMV1 TaxID=631454 RepID=V4RMH4_9HYPH|nr:CoA ester lyase [Lutibaculum baratangense]ESR26474.1 Citryl-CoA lyase [Lutibaculum baratangense AMV1]